jgi:hypothetical protein
LRLDGNVLGAAAQLAPVGVKRMIGKEKMHVGCSNPVKPLSRNNHAPLKDKSSTSQSLSVAPSASCVHLDRDSRDRY